MIKIAPLKVADPFEDLLQEQRDLSAKDFSKEFSAEPALKLDSLQKAERGASMSDFIEMVSMLVTKSMKDDKVIFEPDEGARLTNDAAEKLETPYIFYEVISCTPKSEIKPRSRETIIEKLDDGTENGRPGTIYGQKFKSIIQFNILASGYKEADKVMNSLEDLIFRYTGYMKKKGVAEILFQQHFTDRTLDPYRQHLSARSIQYYIEIEKNYVTFATEFRDISVNR